MNIDQIKSEISYQARVVETSQVGSLTHEIAKIRLQDMKELLASKLASKSDE